MAVELILKNWLRTKYQNNNTLKSTYNVGTTLTVPDTSNSSAKASDMNALLTSLRAMQSNVYLRYSPLWDSVDLTNIDAGTLIADQQKLDINNLVTDLLAMNARYSKNPTEFTDRASNATAFTNDTGNVTTFTQNSTNASAFSNNGSNVSTFTQNSSNATSFVFFDANLQFTFNSTNQLEFTRDARNVTRFGLNSNNVTSFSQKTNANGFTQDSSRFTAFTNNASNCSQTCTRFGFNSANRSGLRFTQNSTNRTTNSNFSRGGGVFSRNTRVSFTRFEANGPSYTKNATNASAFGQGGTYFSQNQDKTATVNRFFRCWQASAFGQNSTNATAFSRDSRASAFTLNSTNATAFSRDSRASAFSRDTRFSQRFVYSFIVKSDGSTTTHSNIGN